MTIRSASSSPMPVGQVGQVAGLVLALDLELGRELVELLTAHRLMHVRLIPGQQSCTWPASTAFVFFIDLAE